MPLLLAEDLTLAYGPKQIFEDENLAIEPGDHLGVVGPNGSGKSTLLRILAGEVYPDGGTVTRARGVRVGYLAQEHANLGEGTLLESVMKTAPKREALELRLRELESELAHAKDTALQLILSEELAEIVSALGHLEQEFGTHRAQKILTGLGFGHDDAEKRVAVLSGGWRMRAALAALLFQDPDVLLLDEPTNHLDMPSVAWLSTFLSGSKKSLVLTCHDRGFLNRHVNRVASLEIEGLRLFRGNYDDYLEQRDMELEHLENRIKNDELRKKELEAFVTRFKAKASKARQAQSKAKLIEKMQEEQVERPARRNTIAIRFRPVSRSGDTVVTLRNMTFGYDETPLFQGLNLAIRRGDRVAIVGVNGAGKSTLLRLIAGQLRPNGGEIALGHNVELAYFAQHQGEVLNQNATILEEVWRTAPELSQTEARGLCGAFLFSGDEVDKRIGVLSGGEKTRVAMAKLLIAPGNLLLLDEPTNHLDTDSADRLTDSLRSYDGTLVFVSHDIDFTRRLSNKVWDVQNGRIDEFPGSIDDYLHHLNEIQAQSMLDGSGIGVVTNAPRTPAFGSDKAKEKEDRIRRRQEQARLAKEKGALEKKVRDAETKVARLEEEVAALERTLADPSTHLDLERSRSTSALHRAKQDEVAKAMEAWEALAQALAEASSEGD